MKMKNLKEWDMVGKEYRLGVLVVGKGEESGVRICSRSRVHDVGSLAGVVIRVYSVCPD